jgi:hypothetical protein
MIINCPHCNRQALASAIIPGLCTSCANEERGICINPLNIQTEEIQIQ